MVQTPWLLIKETVVHGIDTMVTDKGNYHALATLYLWLPSDKMLCMVQMQWLSNDEVLCMVQTPMIIWRENVVHIS